MSTEWQFLVALTEHIRPLKDPVQIQQVAVREIAEHLQASRVEYAHVEGHEFVVTRSYARGSGPALEPGHLSRVRQIVIDACRSGATIAIDDAAIDPRLSETQRAELVAGGILAFIAVPLTKEA